MIENLEDSENQQTTMVGIWTEPTAVELLETALPNTTHLKPLWERIRVTEADGRAWVDLPITAKVTDENADNHARHLYSLLNLLGVPLVPSPMALERAEFEPDSLRPLHYIDPKVEKEKEKARLAALKAEAALKEEAAAEGS